MNKTLIYIGGKYGGEEKNKLLIEKAVQHLRRNQEHYKDTVFISPMHCFGYLYNDTEYLEGLDYCLSLLERCDKCILLDNWKDSFGATVEYGFCKGNDIPIEILPISEFEWED